MTVLGNIKSSKGRGHKSYWSYFRICNSVSSLIVWDYF